MSNKQNSEQTNDPSTNNNNNNGKPVPYFELAPPISPSYGSSIHPHNNHSFPRETTPVSLDGSQWGERNATDIVLRAAEEPHFNHFQMLLASLMLTTILAVGSALDAQNQCISREIYALMELLDDDVAVSDMGDFSDNFECRGMIRHVVIPVAASTLVAGGCALLLIHRHLKSLSKEIIEDKNRRSSNFFFCLKLLVFLAVILASWTFGIFSIMLRPKQNEAENRENPYSSLAAVDRKGHVGDNANLYYLSWISEVLTLALLYQVIVDSFRAYRHMHQFTVGDVATEQHQVETIFYTSSIKLEYLHLQKQRTWYHSMLRLRLRLGFWFGALFSSLLVLASSGYLFKTVLVSKAIELSENQNREFRHREMCDILNDSNFPPQLCSRTSFSVLSGTIASTLCGAAIVLHLFVRHKATNDDNIMGTKSRDEQESTLPSTPKELPDHMHLPLWCEFFFSFSLCVLLGLNAVFATGVQGPAQTVGNLYYASWLSFLLCLRICLGCVEELYAIDAQVEYAMNTSKAAAVAAAAVALSPNVSGHLDPLSQFPPVASNENASTSGDTNVSSDPSEEERPGRLRRYFFLANFCMVCSASAWDAACNQDDPLTRAQWYMIYAPVIVAILSIILFALCLKSSTYCVVTQFWCGGVLSVICFNIWLGDLITTMHSADSWAVNGIGEIEMANLYYFSWSSIITAGLQMMSYVQSYMGMKEKDIMPVVWAAIIKVCFVIFGAAGHIWLTIADNCEANHESGAVTFCSRTIFAMVVATGGMFIGGMVLLVRFIRELLFPMSSTKIRARVEAAVSIFLVLLFGIAVALITGIGGPGQSVGDLYYSTWLAFLVSIGIFVNCYDQIRLEEMHSEVELYKSTIDMDFVNLDTSITQNHQVPSNATSFVNAGAGPTSPCCR